MAAQQAERIGEGIDRLKRIGPWAWRYGLRFVFCSFGPPIAAVIALFVFHWTETAISAAGACLQAVGSAYILWGVRKTRRQFNLPSLSELRAEARREFPRPRPDSAGTTDMTAALHGSSALVGGLGTAEPRDVISRLDALERDYKELRTAVGEHHGDTLDKFRKHALGLDAEKTERTEQGNALRSALRESATGGLNLTVCGIIVGIAAIIFSTFSHRIALSMGGATADPTNAEIVVQPALPRTPLVADAGLVRT